MDAVVSPPLIDHQTNICIESALPQNPVTGYCQMNIGGKIGKTLTAHRLMWRLMRGEIPPGMCICHHCDNKRCININHFYLGTHKDNVRDAIQRGRHPAAHGQRKTICKRGHPYNEANTKWYTKPDGSKLRRCGICQKTLQTQCDARRQAKRVAEREQRKAS